MASTALQYWRGELGGRLDELEQVHASATGTGPGRRWGTEQLNGQLFVALVGQFQSYARDLHDEALDVLRRHSVVAHQLAEVAARRRRLDRGNPSSRNLGEDFGAIGLDFRAAVGTRQHGSTRLIPLNRAITLRNGIAHADPTKVVLAAADPTRDRAVSTLTSYRRHRGALDGLAADMDTVVAQHLSALTNSPPPW